MLKIAERQLALAEMCERHALPLGELWIRAFALGSTNTLLQLDGFLHGALRPTAHEFNVMAVAVNEYLAEIGLDESVSYVEDAFAAY